MHFNLFLCHFIVTKYVFDIIGPLQGLFQKGHVHQKQMTLVTTILVDGVSICTLYQNTPHSQRTFFISPF